MVYADRKVQKTGRVAQNGVLASVSVQDFFILCCHQPYNCIIFIINTIIIKQKYKFKIFRKLFDF